MREDPFLPQDWTERVCTALTEYRKLYKVQLKELGWTGTNGELLSDTAISRRFNHRKPAPELDHLKATFDALRFDPVELFLGVKTGFHPEIELWRFLKQNPDQFLNFRDNHLRGAPRRSYSSQELREITAGLERQRFVDAKKTLDQALDILRHLGPKARVAHDGAGDLGRAVVAELRHASLGDGLDDVAAENWGVIGVIQRQRDFIATAAAAHLHAFYLAKAPAVRARTFQRIGMLLLHNANDSDGALRAIRRARAIYLDAADDSGVGKTFVDEGYLARISGEHRRARTLHYRALRYLAETELENRFGAVQGIALASVGLGQLTEAVRFLDQTSNFPEDRPLMRAAFHWLRGELALALDQSPEALEHLGGALDAAEDADVAPVELVLLRLRVAKAYHLLGDRRAVRWTLQEILGLQDSLRCSQSLSVVLSEFLAVALEDDAVQVTAERLEQVYSRMREAATTAAVAPPLLS